MIPSIQTTKIFVVDTITDSVPQKVKGSIAYEISTKKLKIYLNSAWEDVSNSGVIYADTEENLLLITGEYVGQLAIIADGTLYSWLSDSWVPVGGSGSISLVDSSDALPEDAKAGDVAIATDTNILWYRNDTEWVSTQEKINIPEVYVSVGNITAGVSLENKTNQEMWELLLTKEINPTIAQPSVSFSMSGASNNSLQEIGATLNLTFNTTFNQGKVTNAWGGNDVQSSTYSGLPNTYSFTGTGLTSSVSSTALTNQQTVNPYTVVSGDQTWTASVAYDAGTYQPKTNYGNNYSTTCPAGSKTGATQKITGVYPTFASSVNLNTATKQALKKEPATASEYMTFTLAAESGGKKQFFEIPSTWAAITGVADSGGTWLNGNKANSLLQWDSSSVEETVQGQVVSYKRYTHNAANSGIRTLRVYFK